MTFHHHMGTVVETDGELAVIGLGTAGSMALWQAAKLSGGGGVVVQAGAAGCGQLPPCGRRSGMLARMSGLVEAAQRVLSGAGTPQELLDALLTATVLCEAPERPGVVPARTADGRDVVCVHSSAAQLAAARGVDRVHALLILHRAARVNDRGHACVK